ncbi:response regulator [Methylobacterium iners]|uniref:Transcriptional regulatory protein DegU n=1 Tax=Methylobacterium iners TaxID=418707 RepID=A0ABQ4RSL4_9HYPH|nr:response regulator transcription factor [Methylobacterium iners]GJD93148.1 Transcriptional regulatory protein DegU [Methylobacterium iners]
MMPDRTVIRAVLADDHPVFRHGVADLLTAAGEVDIVASVDTGTAALQAVMDLAPDVVVLDIAMPEMNGVSVARKLVERGNYARAVMLSVYESRVYVEQAFEAGACGYVLKRSAFQNIVQAVRAVSAGGTYLDRSLPGRYPATYQVTKGGSPQISKHSLVDREKEILRYIAFGYTTKEVAALLNIHIKTVETLKSRTCSKLGISSRAQIVQFAILQGWLHGDMPAH